ncbi:DsbE family thiol:disulfide interchange protein [Thiohalorhabdus sp.]|uniref:DsbE family thiol:disulfide interchange protein n=1 Tax=Thiohalorhabdus sp. TaxID=3094134 RepID=UPI002FC336A5
MQARLWIPLTVFVAIVALLGVGLTMDPERVPSPLIGKPLPDFEVARVDDPKDTISPADLEGQVYLLNVWASWCRACRQEHPVLMEASRQTELTIVGLDYKDERPKAREWLRRRGDPYALSAFDPQGKVGIDLGVTGVPETFVVDAEGIVRRKFVGPITRQQLRSEILPLVAKLRKSS